MEQKHSELVNMDLLLNVVWLKVLIVGGSGSPRFRGGSGSLIERLFLTQIFLISMVGGY